MTRNQAIEQRWAELCNEYAANDDFMVPQLEYGKYVLLENKYGEGRLLPAEYADCADDDEKIVERHTGFYARLSAPGYMDCTEYETINSVADVDEFFSMYYGD